MEKYTCSCCPTPRTYSRSDKLYVHRKKHDPSFEDYYKVKEKIRSDYDLDPKKCKFCMASLAFERRKDRFCSHSCSASFNNRSRGTPAPTECRGCGNAFSPGRNSTGKYCSLQCMADYQYNMKINEWLSGDRNGGSDGDGQVANWVRRWLHEKNDSKCQHCGWCKIHPVTGKVPLTVNHIDGNSENHSVDNLELICPSCHSLTPNYGFLNKGNGRTRRRELRQKEIPCKRK